MIVNARPFPLGRLRSAPRATRWRAPSRAQLLAASGTGAPQVCVCRKLASRFSPCATGAGCCLGGRAIATRLATRARCCRRCWPCWDGPRTRRATGWRCDDSSRAGWWCSSPRATRRRRPPQPPRRCVLLFTSPMVLLSTTSSLLSTLCSSTCFGHLRPNSGGVSVRFQLGPLKIQYGFTLAASDPSQAATAAVRV